MTGWIWLPLPPGVFGQRVELSERGQMQRNSLHQTAAHPVSQYFVVQLPDSLPVDAHKAVNNKLWDIENGKRAHEARQCFDDAFIQLSRSVYRLNDQRAQLKREIDTLLGSELTEEKSHPDYGQ
jgi:hypothetical protein